MIFKRISPQQDSYQVIDLSLASSQEGTSQSGSNSGGGSGGADVTLVPFDIPSSEVKRLESFNDLPSHIQTFIQEKKTLGGSNKKSSKRLERLFSKFTRSSKSSSSPSNHSTKSLTSAPQLNALISNSSSSSATTTSTSNNGMGSSQNNTHSNSSSSLGSCASSASQLSQELLKNVSSSLTTATSHISTPPTTTAASTSTTLLLAPSIDAAADLNTFSNNNSEGDEFEEEGSDDDGDEMMMMMDSSYHHHPTSSSTTTMEITVEITPPTTIQTSVLNNNNNQNNPTSPIEEDIDDREDDVLVEFHSSKIEPSPHLLQSMKAFLMRRKFQDYISKSNDVRNARLRRAALLEILSTEESYYSALNTCKTLFMDPLLNDAQTKKKPILNMNDINEIFGELPSIMQASEMLMSDLRKEIAKWPSSPILIGHIFKSFAPFFRMYSKYINNFDSVSEKVEKLEKSSKNFAQFLAKVHETPECGGLTFTSYLVVPVQRVPRIRLLLQEVLKRTDETHVDYAPTEQALSIVNQVAENLNESKRSSENDKVMFELQEKLRGRFGGILQAHRRYIRTFNSIHVESTRELDKKKLNGFYNAYLFNDMLLLVPQYLDRSLNDLQDKKRKGNSIGNSGANSGNGNSGGGASDHLNHGNSGPINSEPMDEEERFQRLAKESFVIYLAFSKVLDREEKELDRINTMMLLTKVASNTPSTHRFNFILKSFIRTQSLNFIFSFDNLLMRDEMEADVTINIEKIDKSMEKKVGQERIDIEKKRIEMCKSIKVADMILSKYLLQKQTGNEKYQQLVEKLSTCENELEAKLMEYRSLKDEFKKQSELLRDIEAKESESLIDYEEQNQKIYAIDTILWKMLNPDRSAFKEVFGEDPRIDPSDFGTQTYSVATSGNSNHTFTASGSIDEYVDSSSPTISNNTSHRKTVTFKRSTTLFNSTANLNFLHGGEGSSSFSALPLKQLKENCNPYIQLAYRETRKNKDHNHLMTLHSTTTTTSTTTSTFDHSSSEEIETLNALYRIRPLKKSFMIEPFKKLPYKYRIDRILYGENTPQEIMPKIIPYPEEYNDVDMYYNNISDRDGFDSYYGSDQYNDDKNSNHDQYNDDNDDNNNTFVKTYDNIYDLPNNVNDLKSMIIKLQMEKEDMRNELNRLKQQQTASSSSSSLMMGMAPLTSSTTTNSSFNENGSISRQHRSTIASSVDTPTGQFSNSSELYASQEIEPFVE